MYHRVVTVLLCLMLLVPAAATTEVRAAPVVSFLDAHTHIARNPRGTSLNTVASQALRLMDRLDVTAAILAPPPIPDDRRRSYGTAELSKLVRDHPGRFAFTAGGETLNPMIQRTLPQQVTPDLRRRFAQEAEAILRAGAAGFGELAVEHFSAQNRGGRFANHPYESAPADHPLFLDLADIAAKAGVPIEIHMEAVPKDMPFPNPTLAGPPNPPTLRENITAFERLLDHNRAARIVWVHAGWDNTGERTVPLMRALLTQHSNLYMTVKLARGGDPRSSPLAAEGSLKPAWESLLRDFPDRFVVGSDQFFDDDPVSLERARRFVDSLPPDLVRAIAMDNVMRIYHLPTSLR